MLIENERYSMSQRRSLPFLVGLLIILLVAGFWWGMRQQQSTALSALYATGTANYHQIETQVYATWTPE